MTFKGKGSRQRGLQVTQGTFNDNWSKIFSKPEEVKTMKIVTISDTHNRHRSIDMPDGDILIVAGDFTGTGSSKQLEEFNTWLGELDYEHIIVVAGNHELTLEDDVLYEQYLTNCVYLRDEAHTVEGIKFYGAPWQPEFCNWAFNLPRGEKLAEKWALIPDNTDVLITHGPPNTILDSNIAPDDIRVNFGCEDLLKRVKEVKPTYHVFGHIHGSYGTEHRDSTTFINTAICTEAYEPLNKPHVFELKGKVDGSE